MFTLTEGITAKKRRRRGGEERRRERRRGGEEERTEQQKHRTGCSQQMIQERRPASNIPGSWSFNLELQQQKPY
ncbi:hypothetical protein D4764_22G0000510 [Takifugu flavidus]|uniref:Uncharacterized protein n=1 Tax=Takifugu flavidus TaxID=433684 RepID=A0A5C6NA92_9TELE|nr:hypothetical protein D4764_22G0000510 [Takifugu flavidus]